MTSINQTIRYAKKQKLKLKRSPKLEKSPFKKAICLKVLTISPKKPNSANRCITKLITTHKKFRIIAKIPGEKNNLQQHSTVLIRGSRVKDLIGVNYAVVRGKLDLHSVQNRKTKRSIYGVKKIS
jgi:small subunit ribosomal protein S12